MSTMMLAGSCLDVENRSTFCTYLSWEARAECVGAGKEEVVPGRSSTLCELFSLSWANSAKHQFSRRPCRHAGTRVVTGIQNQMKVQSFLCF